MGVLCTEMNDRKKKIEEKEKNVKKKTELSSKFEKKFIDIEPFKNNNNVKLEPRLLNIKGKHSCQIKLKFLTEENLIKEEETEEGFVDEETETMSFQKFFMMKYQFEKNQQIIFEISGTIEAKIQTFLQNIMGGKYQTFKKTIEGTDDVIFEVKGFSYENELISILNIDISLKGNIENTGLIYKIINKADENKKGYLYRSECVKPIKTEKEIDFIRCEIPDIYICKEGKYENYNICISFEDALNNNNLGEYNKPLSSSINKNISFELKDDISAIIKIVPIKNYPFIDYLKGGMEINLTVAIDFTSSNNPPSDKNSLHYLGAEKTQYEIAIKSCGDIVAKYDLDQKFPVFGFGGKFYGNDKASHCFPLNGNPSDPEIKGIDGILEAYRDVLNNTELYQPTNFHYIIDKLNETTKKEIEEHKDIYNILMILTDGIIDDMDKTIDSLVEASFLPISVIIIGIGGADFSNFSQMDTLDADYVPLRDRNGRKSDRDLVQFVPFKKFENDGEKLAEQVLEEIPRQIVEYYQHQNISPGEPVFNIS